MVMGAVDLDGVLARDLVGRLFWCEEVTGNVSFYTLCTYLSRYRGEVRGFGGGSQLLGFRPSPSQRTCYLRQMLEPEKTRGQDQPDIGRIHTVN